MLGVTGRGGWMRHFDFLPSELGDVVDRADASGMLACRDLIKGDMIRKGAQSFETELPDAFLAGFCTLEAANQPTRTAPWHRDDGLAPAFRLVRASSSAVLPLMVI